MNERNMDLLIENLKKLDVELDDNQINQFMEYYDLLVEWNKVMNLTTITEFEDVVRKHFIDSLTIVKAIRMNDIESLIDIGTGAGFPGIPIRIVFPDIKVVLLDSLNKRIKFLECVITRLGLKNIECIHGRAEDYARHDKYREQFDLCVSRAVANLTSLSEYCLPYVKVGGYFIPYKSGKIDEELAVAKKAIYLLSGKMVEQVRFNLADTDTERSLIVIEKVKNISKKYPRKAGIPQKEPLKE